MTDTRQKSERRALKARRALNMHSINGTAYDWEFFYDHMCGLSDEQLQDFAERLEDELVAVRG